VNTERIEELVVALSKTPFDPEINFNLAAEYERLDQTASAISFYLRSVEYGNSTHPLLVYTALLRMSICFSSQRDRNWTVSGALLQAIEYLPNRPEAWFLLARFHEREGNWQECYAFAETGLVFANKYNTYEKLPLWVEYHGEYVLRFEKAISSWWVGRRRETFELLSTLSQEQLDPDHTAAVRYNMERLGLVHHEPAL
jgi:tetratricopeptide (TPR) repeat protein